jgi:hypothetical protein
MYWTIIRKSDGYVLETIGDIDKLTQEDAEFWFKNKKTRDAFQLAKCKIKIIQRI